ncbi:isoprenoid biosynthesis glyoxalase ElbB [bacterium]|nr:isoprenoid biosynthesis glyoxalase ElbB [bacterium]
MAKKIGVMLSGCGVYDGSEIHEAVLTILALDRANAEIVYIAPNVNQMHVIDHSKGEPAADEARNVFVESARIARGAVKDCANVQGAELDGLFFPGGFGAAKNLCNFATEGPNCVVHPEVERLVREIHEARKPLGFVCIAPAVAARVIGNGVEVTIGNDEGTAQAIEKMGARHINCAVDEAHFDERNRVATSPAYMLPDRLQKIYAGIEKAVNKVVEWAG